MRAIGPTSVVPRLAALLAILSCVALATADAQENDPNACDAPGESPDVIVGEINGSVSWGSVNGITAFSVGTTSCNVGTCELNWMGDTNDHPVIGQSMYRLRDGRFEQVGQSWLKHGFFALSLEQCDTGCVATDGSTLGVRCSDPYSSGLNGDQGGLGPKFEVNASTGEFPYPFTDSGLTGDAIYKRLQVHDEDLNPALNPGAQYFVEAQYITRDDASARNNTNNASYRSIVVTSQSNQFNIFLSGATMREQPAIMAWAAHDPGVLIDTVDVGRDNRLVGGPDGRFLVGSKAREISPGRWNYEYAVQNLMSHRGMGSFSVPIPMGAEIVSIGFHDVDYHSGEPFDGTDWTAELVDGPGGRYLTWSTTTFDVDPNANALRWGTLYNFRFEADIGPSPDHGNAILGLFRPDTFNDIAATVVIPGPCDGDGVCDADEECGSCPQDCLGPPPQEYCCGDDVCDPGEDECSCTQDCGTCLVPCDVPADCDDGLACNGAEDCVEGFCAGGVSLCGDQFCDEDTATCLECVFSDACDDGAFCNGGEGCVDNTCFPGADPCPGLICIEERRACAECIDNAGCDDGDFCNGFEFCADDSCRPGFPPCAHDEMCDEQADVCQGCQLDRCNDGAFCNGTEDCVDDQCTSGVAPCAGAICDELRDVCIDPDKLQPRPGDPLDGLPPEIVERFVDGRAAFERAFAEADGLGPVFNANACADCHSTTAVPTTVTRFGLEDSGGFDPLTSLGGSLLQAQAIRPECAETLPAQADVVIQRLASNVLGAGLVGALDDADLLANATNPPPGVSGRAAQVPLLESIGTLRIGRYGWKSQQASVLSSVAAQTVDHLGLTNRLLPADHAPNGDAALLAECDAVDDPEDAPVGPDFIDHVADYLSYLAPPPRTPRSGMRGELHFVTTGCTRCHTIQFVTTSSGGGPDPLANRTIRPYSDFLLHDMGANGDPTAQGDALPGEVRTAPLWGLRLRQRLWHDGRFTNADFETRVRAAIAAHDAAGSEAAAVAQAFAGLSPVTQAQMIAFLGSLGRWEFDADGDNRIDSTDYADFLGCFTGPGTFYDANAPCAIHDVDADGDVDADDYVLFVAAFAGQFGGAVPDGGATGGDPLRLDRDGDDLLLTWSTSCVAADTDYSVYQGEIGDWNRHFSRRCSTGGATTSSLATSANAAYFLVVPGNGLTEGSYGVDSAGVERPAAGGSFACMPQWRADSCD